MAGQGLVARPGPGRRHWLTRPAKKAADGARSSRSGLPRRRDQREVVGRLDRDPHRRGQAVSGRSGGPGLADGVAGFAIGEHHDAELAAAAIKMAVAVRGGDVAGVIFHTDYAEDRVKPRNGGVGVCRRGSLTGSSA